MRDEKPLPESRNSAFLETINEFGYWRRRQSELGVAVYDEPAFEGHRIHFRSGFQMGLDWPHWREHGEWSSYTIEPTDAGYLVKHSTKGERSVDRTERTQAVFTRPDDAGKFVVGRMANAVRVDLGLESLIVRWKRSGIDPRLRRQKPTTDQLRFMNQVCVGIQPGLLEKYLHEFSLVAQPQIYALPLPSQEPMMNILPLSFAELRDLLTDGMRPIDP